MVKIIELMSDLIYSDILIKYMHAQASNYEDIL